MIHNEFAQENPKINRHDRRKVAFPGVDMLTPRRFPSSALPLHTRK